MEFAFRQKIQYYFRKDAVSCYNARIMAQFGSVVRMVRSLIRISVLYVCVFFEYTNDLHRIIIVYANRFQMTTSICQTPYTSFVIFHYNCIFHHKSIIRSKLWHVSIEKSFHHLLSVTSSRPQCVSNALKIMTYVEKCDHNGFLYLRA